jgi:hypothetical protein
MNASTVLPPAMQRVSTLLVQGFQKFLMVAGLVFIAGLIGVQRAPDPGQFSYSVIVSG